MYIDRMMNYDSNYFLRILVPSSSNSVNAAGADFGALGAEVPRQGRRSHSSRKLAWLSCYLAPLLTSMTRRLCIVKWLVIDHTINSRG